MTPSERYEKAQLYFSKIEPEILVDIEKSNYKHSLKALYHKTQTIDLIKTSIIKLEGDSYASQILHRSLIEHYILSYYIFLKSKIDDSDEIGENFYDSYSNSEFFKQETYSMQLNDIRNKQVRTVDINVLKEKYSPLKDLSQKDLEKYHEVANQFSNVKKIGDYLLKNKDYEPMMAKVNENTFDLLEKYNRLSSFVHGGPYAERITFDPQEADFNKKLYKHLIDWAFTLAHLSKVYLVLLLKREFYDKYSTHFTALYK